MRRDPPLGNVRATIVGLLKARSAAKAERAAWLEYSRPLDVHTWSDHPEANAFVDAIYDAHFKGRKAVIQKKHLKVVLLDLYLAWCGDPELKNAYSRNVNDYKAKSRYNALHISKLTIDVVDRLIEVGLVVQAKGFKDRGTGIGRQTRMWPTVQLIRMFKTARFSPLDIGDYKDREVIVLRNEHDDDEKYDDTEDIMRMRDVLKPYNELLRATFVDIPTLPEPYIDLAADKFGKQHRLWINQRDKFVRRIFNRGSFEKGGRFWGGWWQRCPKEWRKRIHIDDTPTSEIDYSGLHIVMLYAEKGTDYWTAVGDDPYQIPKPDFAATDEQTREIAKQLLLVALNAADEKETFGAFRNDAAAGSPEKHLTNKQLGHILEQLKNKHPLIADSLASDAGIDLMNRDAQITEKIIQTFTDKSIPVLTVHDSYIVPCGQEEFLERAMQEAFEEVTGIRGVRLKEEQDRPDDIINRGFERKAMDLRNVGYNNALMEAEYQARMELPRTDRYIHQWKEFNKWRRR